MTPPSIASKLGSQAEAHVPCEEREPCQLSHIGTPWGDGGSRQHTPTPENAFLPLASRVFLGEAGASLTHGVSLCWERWASATLSSLLPPHPFLWPSFRLSRV